MSLHLGSLAPDFTADTTFGPLRCHEWAGSDWVGDEVVIVPSLTDPADIAARFPKGYRALKPWLRLTPQPNC